MHSNYLLKQVFAVTLALTATVLHSAPTVNDDLERLRARVEHLDDTSASTHTLGKRSLILKTLKLKTPKLLIPKKLKSLKATGTKLLCSNPAILPDCVLAVPVKIVKGYKKFVPKAVKTYVKIIKKPVLPPPP